MFPSLPRGFVARLVRVVLPLIALCASATASAAVDPSDLLPVDQVFVLHADAPARDRISLHWTIADGYYLYRHRIGVQSATPDFAAATLQLPHGDKHHDEFFGDVETFRKQLTAIQLG
ncbi:MAG TPA: protein-disulfide reductase DsbD domain-containing protein, partial [Luteimonas sp.]|nr:protein-disulfide reductase DsbD domain-containing protein [Luteimonas sp.]